MPETDARIIIDRNLREAGWNIEDKSQVSTEIYADGRADYLLRDKAGRPLAIVEAKKEAIDPYTAKNQAKRYTEDLKIKYAFLANGNQIYFWDVNNSDARPINGFYSQDDLMRIQARELYIKPLSDIPVDNFIVERPYQTDCCKAIDEAILRGKRKVLIEMATGTGKTRTITAEIKRLIQCGLVNKVLFLVDREELANQALGTFKEHTREYGSYIYSYAKPREGNTITVSTLQTLQNHYNKFTAGYFDLVVVDECHRSIYGEWRKILDYFDAIKIGLTATPAILQDRNTFTFFETKQPHFVYGMREAIKDGFLADYTVYVGRTDISLNGVVDTETGETYLPSDLERKITVPERNLEIVRDFKEKAKPNTKSIWFAVNQRHAATLCRMLNEEHPEYKGNYAELIDYTVENKDDIIKRFKNDTLPLSIVSVDMLTTGFDAPKVENIVIVRPTKSPILYQQIRGRGTRLYFRNGELIKNKFVMYDYVGIYEYFKSLGYEEKETKPGLIKNIEYSPKNIFEDEETQGEIDKKGEFKEIHAEDRMIESGFMNIGAGEKIDIRNYKEQFESLIISKTEEIEILKKIKDGKYDDITQDNVENVEKEILRQKGHFNIENLRKAYEQPKADFLDFLKVAYGLTKFPTRQEHIEDIFNGWIANQNFSDEQINYLETLKNQIIANNKRLQLEDLQRPPYTALGGFNKANSLFGQEIVGKIEELNTICFQ
ncbi:MAG: DEAD/DEAH box helicase family protein [Candidatus Gracilibacteria bacterium]|nr:DEAD/DEAH box helicase family protein [Candidatus Gracilibacteria bacterium]